MERVPAQNYPGSDFTPSLSFVASLALNRLYTSPNAVQFAWYRAIPDPSYQKQSGLTDSLHGHAQYVRELQTGKFWCILSDSATVIKRFMKDGTWDSGTVAIQFDPSASPLSIYDWIVPMAQDGLFPPVTAAPTTAPLLPASAVSARTYTAKETIKRGAVLQKAAGTITSSGIHITGTGTAFTTLFQAGDILTVSLFSARVVSVIDDAHLTLDTAPAHDYTAIGFAKGQDILSYSPCCRVALIRSQSRSFVYGTDFIVVSGFPQTLIGDYIQWLSPANSPVPGEVYSIIYDYLARYEMTDFGQKAPVVGGQPLLTSLVANLWKPQTSPDI